MRFQACLNGSRRADAHPTLPCSPDALAADAVAVVALGIESVHVHPRDGEGRESLGADAVDAAVAALRAAVPGLPVGVTTGAWIEPDPERRAAAVAAWTVLPDFASVNLSEPGAVELATLLFGRGVAVEAGVWTAADASLLVASGLAERCLRILIEPREDAVGDALSTTRAVEDVLDEAGSTVPRLLHGRDATAWSLLRAALTRDYAVRVGFEDMLTLDDGQPAAGNAAVVGSAVAVITGQPRQAPHDHPH